MTQLICRGFAAAILVAAAAGAASAEPKSMSVAALVRCADVVASEERLACFDREIRPLKSVGADAKVVRASEVVPARPQFQPIRSVVKSVVELDLGRWLIVLEDQSVWRSLDQTRLEPRAGDAVAIRRGALGSVVADVGAVRGVKLRRMR